MRTPNEYKRNLASGIITEQMLADCLFSMNKRAKNHRDRVREYSHAVKAGEWQWRYHLLDSLEESKRRRDEYYRMKDTLLGVVEPVCLHKGRDCPRANKPSLCRYYKFYKVGDRSFHAPVEDWDVGGLLEKGLALVDIGMLETHGAGIDDLISVQFVRKVVSCVESGEFEYVKG